MEARKQRPLQNGAAYDRFFPRAEGQTQTVRRDASLDDTMAYVPKAIRDCQGQTKAIAARLKGATLRETCSNIWYFVYRHIQYRKDQPGYEQIRSPARAWADRRQGVDCDCYSVFISTILLNLGIPHLLRITKYRQNYFQHIYPVVPIPGGEIIIDCVTDSFDYEVPYCEKKDYPMDLQFLNGIDDPSTSALSPSFAGDGMGELGKIKFKNILNKINKFNPATVLLRNGLLASMKLNVAGVAGKLRWSYLSADQAKAKGMDAQKFKKLLALRKKVESIFYGAGGTPKNLKNAILKGKGNKNKAVIAGLGMLEMGNLDAIDINTPLDQLLGAEVYYSENERVFQGFTGFGALGEPLTLTSVTAASGVIASLVAALKKIGNLFGGKAEPGAADSSSKSTGDGASATTTDSSGSSTSDSSSPATVTTPSSGTAPSANTDADGSSGPSATDSTSGKAGDDDSGSDSTALTPGPAVTTPVMAAARIDTGIATTSGTDANGGFWSKNKKWLKPVAIGAGGIVVLAVGYHLIKAKPHSPSPPLSGTPKKNHHRKTKKTQPKRKTPVALL